MELISSAIGIGILLSVVFIGPVFFLLIETSIRKNWKAALTLDLGVVFGDLLCVLVAYFGSKDLMDYITTHPKFYRIYLIGGFFVVVYGLFMYLSKPNLHIDNKKVASNNYIKTFFNGFIVNLLNLGVIVFWFVIVSSSMIKYPKPQDFALYIGVILSTYLAVDLIKIMLARRLQKKLTDQRVYQIRKIVGICLSLFGLIIILKGFGLFKDIDEKIEHNLVNRTIIKTPDHLKKKNANTVVQK